MLVILLFSPDISRQGPESITAGGGWGKGKSVLPEILAHKVPG
jgi:hypothetical protein